MYADYENEGGANRFSDNRKQSLKDKMKRVGAQSAQMKSRTP